MKGPRETSQILIGTSFSLLTTGSFPVSSCVSPWRSLSFLYTCTFVVSRAHWWTSWCVYVCVLRYVSATHLGTFESWLLRCCSQLFTPGHFIFQKLSTWRTQFFSTNQIIIIHERNPKKLILITKLNQIKLQLSHKFNHLVLLEFSWNKKIKIYHMKLRKHARQISKIHWSQIDWSFYFAYKSA